MPLIIDGYNLLHVTGISGSRGDLQGSRDALLRFLAAAIDAKERPLTTIVFDAAEAPPGLPRVVVFEEMTVRYASDYENADELIEELIAQHHVPRSLTVVSSDHRIQRAARRRRAPFLDSDVWFAEAVRHREKSRRPATPTVKPQGSLGGDEIEYWLNEFTDPPQPDHPQQPGNRKQSSTKKDNAVDLSNPFPPGYGEDLLDGA
jgi:predicted RNA-binding protein with PIN domain